MGADFLLATPKSGIVDPDRNGSLIWKVSLTDTVAPTNGEIVFGGAADSQAIYLPLGDGGFVAVDLATGHILWRTQLESLDELGEPTPTGEYRTKQVCALASRRPRPPFPAPFLPAAGMASCAALSTADGKLLWQFNTNQRFKSVNKVATTGGSMGGPGAVVVNGMVYVGSGYARIGGGLPGNVLLAFSVAPSLRSEGSMRVGCFWRP